MTIGTQIEGIAHNTNIISKQNQKNIYEVLGRRASTYAEIINRDYQYKRYEIIQEGDSYPGYIKLGINRSCNEKQEK